MLHRTAAVIDRLAQSQIPGRRREPAIVLDGHCDGNITEMYPEGTAL